MRRSARSLAVVLLIAVLGAGCASRTKTVVSSRTVHAAAAPQPQAPSSTVVERETATTTTTPAEPRGVLSTVVHVIGEIIALPFRLIGGVLRAIF